MVQYIFTPWRDRSELLMARSQFYPARYHQHRQCQDSDQRQWTARGDFIQTEDEKEASSAAVARVSMWMQRGNCPHLVESTALLTAAILDDERSSSSSSYAVRAAYSAAFSRFVTGLLDSHQDKQRKMSMYGVAKSVGLPATFVELRHQATHEQLPSLIRLRGAARKALDWIWDYYWRHLSESVDDDQFQIPTRGIERHAVTTRGGSRRQVTENEGCREALIRHLDKVDVKKADLSDVIEKFGEAEVFNTLSAIVDATMDTQVLRRAMAITTEMMLAGGEGKGEQATDGKEREEAQRQPSWSMYEEDEWIPKPIGVV